MFNHKFGIEVEFTGLTRKQAAKTVAQHFSSTAEYTGGICDAWRVKDQNGREWKIVFDSSVSGQKKEGRRIVSASSQYKVELVSPIFSESYYRTIFSGYRGFGLDISVLNEAVRKSKP